jgi:hypothetical protein
MEERPVGSLMGGLEWSASCSGEVGGREERPWREVICSIDGGGKSTPAEQTIESDFFSDEYFIFYLQFIRMSSCLMGLTLYNTLRLPQR